jgi:putative cell wall-binding protein
MRVRGLRRGVIVTVAAVAAFGPGLPRSSSSSAALPGEAATRLVSRLFGADRYDTAADLSRQTFAIGVPLAVVATGTSFPDALAGAAAAGAKRGPVLLVQRDRLPGAVSDELRRLKPRRVLVLGGSAAISDDVLRSVDRIASADRIAGADRFATAVAASSEVFGSGVPVAFIATGGSFPDALAGAAAAGAKGGPVLLATRDTLPSVVASELRRLKPQRIVALGGVDAIGDGVLGQLREYASNVERIAGRDRYETAASIASWGWPAGASHAYVASGTGFADALAGAAAGAATNRPVLLVPPGEVPQSVASALERLGVSKISLLGGATAVAEPVVALLSGLATPLPTPALSGSYLFDSVSPNGAPYRWNPCAPIHWVLHRGSAPDSVIADVNEAFRRLAAVTGLTFTYDGLTAEIPQNGRPSYQPAAYGDRWAPVVVSFVRPEETDLPIGGQTVGWTVVSISGSARVSATVTLNSAASLTPGFGSGASWGSLLLHELGHLAGLSHVDDRNQVMFPVIGVPDYAAGDRAGLSQLGSAKGCVIVPKAA